MSIRTVLPTMATNFVLICASPANAAASTNVTFHLDIDHTYRGDLVVDIGYGSPHSPQWVRRILNREGGSRKDFSFDKAYKLDLPEGSVDWFVRVHDAMRFDQGSIEEFGVSYGGVTQYSKETPVKIADRRTSIASLVTHTASNDKCPAPLLSNFNSKWNYYRDWEEVNKIGAPWPEYNGSYTGEFKSSYVDTATRSGYLEFEHKGYIRRGKPYAKGGELRSNRNDFHYGTYSFSAKLPNNYWDLESHAGFVFGMFMYSNDENEIDFEYTYRVPRNSSQRSSSRDIRVVTHTASSGASESTIRLPDHCVGSYCNYSFVWLPESVTFYVEGKALKQMRGNKVPTEPGEVIVNLWSGRPNWGGKHPTDGKKRYAYLNRFEYRPICAN